MSLLVVAFYVTCAVANIACLGICRISPKTGGTLVANICSHTSTPVNAAKGSTASRLVEFPLEVCTSLKDQG